MRHVVAQPIRKNEPVGFTVVRVPFFLEPEYSEDESWSESNRARLHRKWGSEAGFEAQKRRHRLKERGREVGIQHFNLDRRASSTLASHRLVQWVTREYGITHAETLYDRLNNTHFVDGRPLNDRTMLIGEAAAAGVDAEAAAAFLQSDEGREGIRRTQSLLQEMGISSIPTFVLGGQKVVGGAASAETLVHELRVLEALPDGAPHCVFGEALGLPEAVLQQTLDLRDTAAGRPACLPAGR